MSDIDEPCGIMYIDKLLRQTVGVDLSPPTAD
jgi:hypothetical protein